MQKNYMLFWSFVCGVRNTCNSIRGEMMWFAELVAGRRNDVG